MTTEQEILKRRTAETARPLQQLESRESIDVIRFSVGDEVYALKSDLLSEVQRFRQPTPVPYLPAYIVGILYVRGRFISVVDLGRFLGVEANDEAGAHSILLLGDGETEFGIIVDEVFGEHKLPHDDVQPVSRDFFLARQDLIAGVTEEGTVLLDGRRLLKDPAMKIQHDTTTSTQGRENA